MSRSSDENENSNPIFDLAMVILAPLMATLIQLAVSRSREYQADATAARLTGRPMALASGLAKLERGNLAAYVQESQPATAHLMIVNPLRGEGMASLFSTHPSISSRIERLRAIASAA